MSDTRTSGQMMEQHTAIGYRPTWAEIDLDNLSYNLRRIRAKLKNGVKIMACVKAEAYGHGLIPVSHELVDAGVDFLAVASIDEAMALRAAGINCRVLILGLVLAQNVSPLFDYHITPTVCSLPFADALNKEALKRRQTIDIHIKIDTGMSRIGIAHDKAYDLIRQIYALPNVRIEGIFTHLACADTDEKLTHDQIRLFEALVKQLEDDSITVPLVHAANSMGVVAYKNSHFNMVRPGLILYGLHPAEDISMDLRPVMSLKTKVIFVKDVAAGCGVSYGHTYVTRTATRIATLPIGYGDGYPRNLSNIAPVLINGRKFTIAGRVCMDQIMVDVGNADVSVGDEAILIGSQLTKQVNAEQLASLAGTIPYEIVCGIGSRVPRVYRKRSRSPEEKRAAVRRAHKIPVRFLDTPSLADTVGITEDISSGGLKLFTPDPVLPYHPYRLSLEARHKAPVHVVGTPVWSRPADNNRYVCGIKFSQPLK